MKKKKAKQSGLPPEEKRRFHYIDVIVTLLAVMVVPIYLYGVWVLWLLAAALAAALATEFLCNRLAGRGGIPKGDYSWAVTALVITMLMPATAPVWIVIFSVVFGLVVAKHPFGGTGRNIFNPAAAGVAFSAICWPEMMLRYPLPFTMQNVSDPSLIQYGSSPASVLAIGGTPKIDRFDILLGKFAGPLGATCMIVLAACLLYLLLRRRASVWVTLSAFLLVFAFAALLPRVVTGRTNSVIFEFAAGGLVFGVIFMANDPTTMPNTKGGQVFYGLLIGLFTVLMRRFGAMELEIVYVILLANIFAHSCDRYAAFLVRKGNELLGRTRRHAAVKHRKAGGEHA